MKCIFHQKSWRTWGIGKIIVIPKPMFQGYIGGYVTVNKNRNLDLSYSATEFKDQTTGVDDQGNQWDPICRWTGCFLVNLTFHANDYIHKTYSLGLWDMYSGWW